MPIRFQVDPDFYDHPKVTGMSDAAFSLWVRAGSFSAAKLTDGFISEDVLAYTLRSSEDVADELARRGLWRRTKGGWRFHADDRRPLGRITRRGARPWIPNWVRRAVLDRDGHQCLKCGATNKLTLDHILPWSRGGPDTVENLRVLCKTCNSRKGARD